MDLPISSTAGPLCCVHATDNMNETAHKIVWVMDKFYNRMRHEDYKLCDFGSFNICTKLVISLFHIVSFDLIENVDTAAS